MIKVLLGVFLCSKCTTDRRIGRNNVTSDSSQASIIVLKVPVWSVRAHRASLQHAKNHIISPPRHLAAEGLTQRAARRFRKPEERSIASSSSSSSGVTTAVPVLAPRAISTDFHYGCSSCIPRASTVGKQQAEQADKGTT